MDKRRIDRDIPLVYECFDCEDTEDHVVVLPEHYHCECGAHMFLKTKDRFKEDPKATICIRCLKQNTDYCIDCTRNPANE